MLFAFAVSSTYTQNANEKRGPCPDMIGKEGLALLHSDPHKADAGPTRASLLRLEKRAQALRPDLMLIVGVFVQEQFVVADRL